MYSRIKKHRRCKETIWKHRQKDGKTDEVLRWQNKRSNRWKPGRYTDEVRRKTTKKTKGKKSEKVEECWQRARYWHDYNPAHRRVGWSIRWVSLRSTVQPHDAWMPARHALSGEEQAYRHNKWQAKCQRVDTHRWQFINTRCVIIPSSVRKRWRIIMIMG